MGKKRKGRQFFGVQMPGGAGAPNFGPPEEGVKRISEVEAHVQTMENSLGLRHPRVSLKSRIAFQQSGLKFH